MPNKYKLTAESVGYLEQVVEAKDEDEAWAKLEELLEQGALPEVDGSIENKDVELVEVDGIPVNE